MLNFKMDMPLYLMAIYGSMMIAVVCLLRGVLKNRFPKFVFPVLWGLVLLRLLVPFSLSSPISAPIPNLLPTPYISEGRGAEVTTTSEGVSATDIVADNVVFAPDFLDISTKWLLPLVLSIVFCLGFIATAGVLLYQRHRYLIMLKNSLLVEHNETINEIIRGMGMGHILVFTNDEIASPLVSGVLRPRIYLPTRIDFQNTVLLQHIIAHETMHIKRKDNWVKVAMLTALCLNWYNPLVWLMSKYLSSDLEAACDMAVLNQIGTSEKQNYAFSLLSMAITGNRSTLLYSAFSKTEVERRIKSIISYKKATALSLALSIIFLLSGTVVFASGGQAPFSADLSSYCSSTNSRWGVKASLSRDISLGKNPGTRANNAIFDVLDTDDTSDPTIIAKLAKTALAKEFGVEKSAFLLDVSLCLSDEELTQEYAAFNITENKNGIYRYQEETVRTYTDEMLGFVQSNNVGTVDITVVRNQIGIITEVTALHQGDPVFDRRTNEVRRYPQEDVSTSVDVQGSIDFIEPSIVTDSSAREESNE